MGVGRIRAIASLGYSLRGRFGEMMGAARDFPAAPRPRNLSQAADALAGSFSPGRLVVGWGGESEKLHTPPRRAARAPN